MILAVQFPSYTVPFTTVKESVNPSIVNPRTGRRLLPFLSMIPEPFSDVRVPETLNVSPATGLAEIESTTKIVIVLTVTVLKVRLLLIKVKLPEYK